MIEAAAPPIDADKALMSAWSALVDGSARSPDATRTRMTSATPMRRRSKLSGFPNRRRSVPGTASASATPSKATAAASTPP